MQPGLHLALRRITSSAIKRQLLLFLIAAIYGIATMVQPVLGQQNPDYKLGPDDVISITVMNHPELSGEFLIPSDGAIDLPRGGLVTVTGKTLPELSELVELRLKDTLRDPEVTIALKSPRAQLVHVMGVVQKPGPYSIKPNWRITEVISAAGGLLVGIEPADCTINILQSATGEKKSVPLLEVMRGNESSNLMLQAGDVITVESVELIPVYIMGKVNRPGLYNLRKNGAGVLEAITMAGGTLENAALSKVTITHLTGETETVSIVPVTVEGTQENSIKLRSGDLLVVPDSVARFAVLGWVNSPGFFTMKENQAVTLSDALGLAKGVDNKRSGLKKVAVLRNTDGKQEKLIFNFTKFTKDGDASQNPEIKSGDIVWVPESDSINLDKIMSKVTSALSFLWLLNR